MFKHLLVPTDGSELSASTVARAIDFAKEVDANLIIRGIRTVKDFEYEETIADINRKLTGIETILLFTEPELTCVSSTTVRELLQFGKDISMFIPEGMEMSDDMISD